MKDATAQRLDESVVDSVQRTPQIRDLAVDLSELGVDELLERITENEALQAIPVVKSLLAMFRGALSVREAIFTKKLLKFVVGVGDVSEEDTQRWRRRTNHDPRDMGERIIVLVDRLSALWKAELMGRVFRLYLDGKCERSSFLRAAEMIDVSLTDDLSYLLHSRDRSSSPAEHEDDEGSATANRLISVGLMTDRSVRLLAESAGPPVPSEEGELLLQAVQGESS